VPLPFFMRSSEIDRHIQRLHPGARTRGREP
jgi:hypothetical protein